MWATVEVDRYLSLIFDDENTLLWIIKTKALAFLNIISQTQLPHIHLLRYPTINVKKHTII